MSQRLKTGQLSEFEFDCSSLLKLQKCKEEIYFAHRKNPRRHELAIVGSSKKVSIDSDLREFHITNNEIIQLSSSLDCQTKITVSGAINWSVSSQIHDRFVSKSFTFDSPTKEKIHGSIFLPESYSHESISTTPIVLYVYGGPGVQLITDSFPRSQTWKHICSRGYAVVSIDPRGTANRGLKFGSYIHKNPDDLEDETYHFGHVELNDQILALDHLKNTHPGLDFSRIAVSGWSYGGYLTLLAMAERNDVFRLGFSGAPVTDWQLYDTAYTERYLNTPQNNSLGYQKSNIIGRSAKFPDEPGRLFLFHGLKDENVVVENTTRLINELTEIGKPYVLQVFPNERHGMRTPRFFSNIR